jgi:hypothetical protein
VSIGVSIWRGIKRLQEGFVVAKQKRHVFGDAPAEVEQ